MTCYTGVGGTAIDVGVFTGSMGMSPVIMFGGYPLAFMSTAEIVVAGTASFIGIRRF